MNRKTEVMILDLSHIQYEGHVSAPEIIITGTRDGSRKESWERNIIEIRIKSDRYLPKWFLRAITEQMIAEKDDLVDRFNDFKTLANKVLP